jgi:hypothetical protein
VYGVVTDVGAGPYWTSFANGGLEYFTPFNVSSDTSPPHKWIINTSAIDELSLKAKVKEKARQLKADVLLNIVEANQIWPSITTLVLSVSRLGKIVRKNTILRSVNVGSNIPHIVGTSAPLWNRVRPLLRTSSSTYLAWKFGISPIISDFESILKYLPKLKADVKRHIDNEASRFSSIAEGMASCDTTETLPAVMNGYTVSQWGIQGRVLLAPSVRYVLVVKPHVTKYHSAFFGGLDALISRFATSPARLAWEKVPFSFVVDWLFDLKEVLDTLDRIVGFSPYHIVSFTRSFTYKLATDISIIRKSPCDGHVLFSSTLGTAEFSHYERSLVAADGFSVRWQPRFGKNQAAISAALIAQQLTKFRR